MGESIPRGTRCPYFLYAGIVRKSWISASISMAGNEAECCSLVLSSSSSNDTSQDSSAKNKRIVCPHCRLSLSRRTYYRHKRLFYSSVTHSWAVCDKSETTLSHFEGKEGSTIPTVSDSDSEMDFMQPSEVEWD